MKGLIVVHGTSQDITSINETTVHITRAARAAGHLVVNIGGPGSTERSILRGIVRDPLRAEYTPIDEIALPLDYGWDVLAGTATGAGMDDIVADIKRAVREMIEKGVTSIDLLGFSRGAVSLAMALDAIGKELGGRTSLPVPVRVCLLDPVPGPYLVPQEITIPPIVKECMLLTSKHEGRLGFRNLGLSVDPGVRFTGDLVMGVHGDIGGSTQSPLTRLVKDRVAEFLGLPTLRLTPMERYVALMLVILAATEYTNPGWMQRMSRRAIGWSVAGHEGTPGTVELPYASALEQLDRMREIERWREQQAMWERIRRNEREFEERRREIMRWREQHARMEELAVVHPERPIRNPHNQIVFPAAAYHARGTAVSTRVVKQMTGFLRWLPK